MRIRSNNKPGRTPLRAALLAGATVLAFMAGPGVAQANIMQYRLTKSVISNHTTGQFGTITLEDGSGASGNGITKGYVKVTESLNPNVYAFSGTAYNLEFTLGSLTISTSDIANLMFTGTGSSVSAYDLYNGPQKPKNGTLGNFGLAIDCRNCGNGTSTLYNKLSFEITDNNLNPNLKTSDFTPNSANIYFLSDIGIVSNGTVVGTGSAYTTGSGNPVGPGVPEPGSLALLGTGLIGLGLVIRRRRRS